MHYASRSPFSQTLVSVCLRADVLTPCITRLRPSSKQRRTTRSALLLGNITAVTFPITGLSPPRQPVSGSALMFIHPQKGQRLPSR